MLVILKTSSLEKVTKLKKSLITGDSTLIDVDLIVILTIIYFAYISRKESEYFLTRSEFS